MTLHRPSLPNISPTRCVGATNRRLSLKNGVSTLVDGSIVMFSEDAEGLFAIIHRTSGTISWDGVASAIGTTVENAREQYMRALNDHSIVEIPVLDNNEHPVPFTLVNTVSSTSSSINTPAFTSTTAEATSSSTPVAASTSSNADRGTVTAPATQISDLRPRVLTRLNGGHRACCFYGYKWCCHALGCVKYSQCGYDLRVHYRKIHRKQRSSFDFARPVHRTEQEAKAWAQGEDMDVDEKEEE